LFNPKLIDSPSHIVPQVNPVRNSGGALNPALRGMSPSLRAGGLSEPEAGAEPGSERAVGHYF